MRSRKLATVLLSASLAMGMAACGDDDDPVSTAGGGQTGSTTPTPANTGVAAATTSTTTARATVMTANSPLGTILVDSAGKTLYTWDRDSSETSTCTGGCATTWPPLVLPAGTDAPVPGNGVSGLTAAARPDDATKMQVVSNGKPLYYYSADTAPGDTKGEGVGGTWHVAQPA
jgi:predicted lipoprotein with Yx(FWY)xxD motif